MLAVETHTAISGRSTITIEEVKLQKFAFCAEHVSDPCAKRKAPCLQLCVAYSTNESKCVCDNNVEEIHESSASGKQHLG